MILEFELPLPPSKNRQTIRKAVPVRGRMKYLPVLSPEVLDYRGYVSLHLKKHAGKLPDKQKIVVMCVWYRENPRADVHNWHQQLADAIAPALGLNDRYFLIRDMDVIETARGHGKVWVQMQPTTAIKDSR